MIKYANNHPEEFNGIHGPFVVALMQLSSALFTEIINICVICSLTDIQDIIMNFIALAVISEFDNFYAKSVVGIPIKKTLDAPLSIKRSSKDIQFSDRSLFEKFVRIVYRISRIFYASYYYYFMAFTVIPLTYLASYQQESN